jgi:hypothetical protein
MSGLAALPRERRARRTIRLQITDTEIDGLTSATVFGVIAFCACLFDAAAVRLWFMGHRIGACVIGPIAAAAFVVTVTNSLGGIAGRGDSNQAERNLAKAEQAEDRAELARITRQREALSFTPTTDEVVKVASDAVTTAEQFRIAECERRGPKCRERESEEQAKHDALAAVLTNKALTHQAGKLDTDAARVRAKLANAPKVQNANPLGAALEQMSGATAAMLIAWQQTIVAVVFELCLLGVMVIFELLGHRKMEEAHSAAALSASAQADATTGALVSKAATPRCQRRPRIKAKVSASRLVKTFFQDHVQSAPGASVEMKALTRDIRVWASSRGLDLPGIDELLDHIAEVCQYRGIDIEVGEDERVHCLGIRLTPAAVPAVH